MAVREEKSLYEILVRLGKDGVLGVHAKDHVRVLDGEAVIAERITPARPVEAAELSGLFPAEQVAADLSRLQSEIEAERAQWARERSELKQQVREARADAARRQPPA